MIHVRAGDVEPIEVLALQADRTGVTGSSNLRVEIRKDHPSQVLFYDFADQTFKTSGWTTRQGTLAEVSASLAPGAYRLPVDTTGWAAGDYIVTVREVSTTAAANLPDSDVIRVGGSIPDISSRLPAVLVGGRVDASVGAVASGAVTSSGFAAGAITNAALADDAITAAKIAAGAITASEAPLLANLDTTVSSRAAPGAAMDLVDNAVDAGALAVSGISAIQTGLATTSALSAVGTDAASAASRAADIQGRLPAALAGGRMDASVGAVSGGAITAAAIAADAIGASQLAASAVSEIQSGLATASSLASVDAGVAAVVTSVSDLSGRLPAALVNGRIDASIGAAAAGVITASSIATDAIGATQLAASAANEIRTGLALAADLATLDSKVVDIQGRLPAALVGGRIDASVGAMAANTLTAAALAADAGAEIGASVWATAVSAPASNTYGRYVQRLHQLGFNRLELASTGGGLNTLYGDDGTTPIVTFAIRDGAGASISLPSAAPARRGAGAEQ